MRTAISSGQSPTAKRVPELASLALIWLILAYFSFLFYRRGLKGSRACLSNCALASGSGFALVYRLCAVRGAYDQKRAS